MRHANKADPILILTLKLTLTLTCSYRSTGVPCQAFSGLYNDQSRIPVIAISSPRQLSACMHKAAQITDVRYVDLHLLRCRTVGVRLNCCVLHF